MENDDDNKKPSKKSKETLKKEREELKQLIIQYTEAATGKRYTDEHIDREQLKVELQGGRWFYISDVERFMKARARAVDPIFKLEYYEEIYRLRGWPVERAKDFTKPAEVADYTNELIYGRFKPEILEAMQIVNPWRPGEIRREHWHYQFLTDEGLELAKGYIDDSIKLMKTCQKWHECRVKFYEQHDIPYQMDIFDENGNVK